jgi:predicted phage terminase large subunit-like protein
MAFLLLDNREAMYGGAAGGGKSDALLMGALEYADTPGYNAILFRRTYVQLSLPEALMDRAMQWLGGTAAHWNAQKHMWTFPSGARLSFGNLERDVDKYIYQSAEFQYIGFDELTQFNESQYRYLFSRLRRLENVDIPLRMRSATNPGGVGHDWVKRRFLIEGPSKGRIFIPARIEDNPSLDRAEYIETLQELDPITRRQLLRGDWTARHGGSKFRREWFQIVDQAPADARRVRYWDIASTEPKKGEDPDYTAGLKLALKDGVYYVEDVRRTRATPQHVQNLIQQTTRLDGRAVKSYMEQEPGASGKALVDFYQRKVVVGYPFYADKVTGNKEIRSNPVSSAAEAGNVKLVSGAWNGDFLDEVEAFPLGAHDDQVDTLSGAFEKLTIGSTGVTVGRLNW